MKIDKADFILSAVSREQYPKDALPEIVLAGRSNVGKSSFINKMLNRKHLAKTSSKPGKTQTLNFYLINRQFYFVDAPGYGYARVSKAEKEKWGQMIEQYFAERESLRAAALLVDLRHPPTADDQMMREYLNHYDIPMITIATKADKVPKGKWQKHQKAIRETLQLRSEEPIVLFSSETGQGKDEAWKQFLPYLKARD